MIASELLRRIICRWRLPSADLGFNAQLITSIRIRIFMDTHSPADLASGLVDILTVSEIGSDLFEGARNPHGVGRLFGGQAIAQALAAACKTVSPERAAHSLHAYFLRPGSEDHHVTYKVERDFDGGSFSNRRVIAVQQGKPILNLAASFHKREEGLSHQNVMPTVPDPDTLQSDVELRNGVIDTIPEKFKAMFTRPRPIEFRPVDPRPWMKNEPQPPVQRSWFRVSAPIGDEPDLHRAIVAYASDMQLLGTCTLPHGLSWMKGEIMTASLDHAIWFHGDMRADEWLLYACDSPWSGRGRGMNHGKIFTRDGRLVASVAQEGLLRRMSPPAA
jgi:acyl-CoA thioesterase II